jgi:hypothetical protein
MPVVARDPRPRGWLSSLGITLLVLTTVFVVVTAIAWIVSPPPLD